MEEENIGKIKIEGIDYEIIDISPLLSVNLKTWPGDEAYSLQANLDIQKNDRIHLSTLKTTLHLGAHVDSPLHYNKQGQGMSERSLNYYMGPCQIVEIYIDRGKKIELSDFDLEKITEPRVLFKTNSYPDPNHFNEDFNSISSEVIESLSDKSVILVGIDSPSIDCFDSKLLESHNMVYEKNMSILEGVVLHNVSEGVFELIALPLKLENADASPVRAVLRRFF